MGILRQPRAMITVNGTDIVCLEVEVELSKTHDSDCVHAKIAIDALPPAMDANWWSTANAVAIQAKFSNDGPATVQLFDGLVDRADFDYATNEMSVSGRCKTAKMVDKRHKKKHINQHHHEIVQEIASAHGLTVNADPVTDKAGKLYQIDVASMPHQSTEWSYIQHLAEQANMDCYATGGQVYFKNPGEQLPVLNLNYTPPTSESYASGNFITLKASRNFQLGRPVSHKVSSWHHKQKQAFTDTETEPGVGDPLEFHHNEPLLSQEQTSKIAKKRLRDTTKHEFTLDIEMPGDTAITPRYTLNLTGTGAAFDQQHDLATVKHSLSEHGGYRMTLSTKTKSKKRGKK